MFGDLFGHGFDNRGIFGQQVVATHARFARQTGSDDDDVGIRRIGIIIGADNIGIKPFHRGGLHQVQSLALGQSVNNIDQADIAQFLGRRPMRRRGADKAGPHYRYLVSSHCHRSTPLIKHLQELSTVIGFNQPPASRRLFAHFHHP